MSQDRDLVEEERQARLAARADDRTRPSTGGPGMDPGTKKLAIVAGGLGALLVLMVGGWSLLGHHPSGIPILSPPPGPVRVKPLDPGGMQLMGTQVAPSNASDAETLQPGPEQAAPQALQAEVDKARGADRPPVTTPRPAAPTDTASTPANPPVVASNPTNPAPVVPPTPAPERLVAKDAAPTPTPEPTAPADAAPPPSIGHHAVQLAALDSDQAAHTEWSRLSRKAPALFAGRTPVITSISRDGKLFFRLRTSGFDTIADATAFCSRAKAAGLACTLADF